MIVGVIVIVIFVICPLTHYFWTRKPKHCCKNICTKPQVSPFRYNEYVITETKVCTKCRMDKKIKDYYVDRSVIGGRSKKCRKCVRARTAELKVLRSNGLWGGSNTMN